MLTQSTGVDIIWIVILLLLVCLILCLIRIMQIKHELLKEKQKRIFPLVILRSGPEDKGLYLSNEGSSIAKDINIEDIEFTVDYGFTKTLNLKFDPIEFLAPAKTEKLIYRVFDGEYPLVLARDLVPQASCLL